MAESLLCGVCSMCVFSFYKFFFFFNHKIAYFLLPCSAVISACAARNVKRFYLVIWKCGVFAFHSNDQAFRSAIEQAAETPECNTVKRSMQYSKKQNKTKKTLCNTVKQSMQCSKTHYAIQSNPLCNTVKPSIQYSKTQYAVQ